MKINNRTYPGLNRIIQQYKLPVYCIRYLFVETVFENYQKIEKSIHQNTLLEKLKTNKFDGIYIIKDRIVVYFSKDNGEQCELILFTRNGDEVVAIEKANQTYFLQGLFKIFLFMEYAEIETKILPPKTESNDGIKCVYSNHSKFPITFIDSTWFTNLVKSDAFKVSGHFRLQPCHDENGMPTKKLIWINDFVKSGYTSPARKLKQ